MRRINHSSRFISQFENPDYMRFSFDDICYDDTKSATKIPASEYLEQGTYPIYDQATDSIIAGFSNDSSGLNKEFPVVLFGDHSRVVKYIDRAFYIGADGVKILRPINADLSTEFLYYQLQFKEVPNTGYNRHFKYLKLFSYCCPNVDEQRAFLAICHQADKSKFSGFKSRFIEMFGPETALLRKYPVKKLGDLADCYAGATPSTTVREYWDNGTISWMSSGEVHLVHVDQTEAKITQKGYDHASTKMVPIHSVVIALAGQGRTRGTVAITEIPLCTNQSLCAIVPGKELHYEYLFHNLNGRYLELRGMAGDVNGRGGLNLRIIQNIPIVVPPMDDQLAFVMVARQADKSKFNGFKSRFIEMFQDAPKTKLGDFCELKARIGWQGLKHEEFLDKGDYYLVTGIDFVGTSIDWSRCHFITKDRDDQDPNIQLHNGDILVTKDGTIGKVAIVSGLETPATLNSGVFVIRDKKGLTLNSFLFYCLLSKEFERFVEDCKTGSTIAHLNQKAFVNYLIPTPEVNAQKQFVSFATQADKSKYLS